MEGVIANRTRTLIVVGLLAIGLLVVLLFKRRADDSGRLQAGPEERPTPRSKAERSEHGSISATSSSGREEAAASSAEGGGDGAPSAGERFPVERPPSGADASRERIAAIRTSAEAADVHRSLTGELISRLGGLAGSHDRDAIRVAIQELADRFYLLDRVVVTHGLQAPGPGSVGESNRARVEALVRIWGQNTDLSLTVDELFRQRGLLPDEHVPQTLRKWLESTPD